MAYVTCYGPCAACYRIFAFNPNSVPSVRVHGQREPICRSCIEWANTKRKLEGKALIEILPDAYEPLDEYEL